ncbi:uncharacterized protein LOC112009845 [Quercus suber]|uniref:uncharacterized protein LOC112009845 n=1 Tax=Quercus suber TaxID=58331 RepID=UPI000CE1F8BB|nr:uncharacterized protein LOC112009845 [Quercus suber]
MNSLVAALINESTRSWRTNVIEHVFEPAKAAIIKGIPLCSFSQQDKLIWPFTPSGQYTVKSGYRFLYEGSAPTQASTEDSLFWKKIWDLEVPNKVKNFVWQACKEALPTKENLYRRKIAQDALCENFHVKEAACPLDQILNLSKERKAEFQGTRPPTQKRVHRNHVGWRPQIVDEVKINYDGAIFSREGRVGLGVVCCNSDAVITSLSEQISLPATITQVEALAVRRAAVFAVDLGITSTILEGDSNIVYKDLSSIEPSLALHGHIIHDVK